MVKHLLIGAVLAATILLGISDASAAVRVRGYFRSNGTYVAPHYRSDPDGIFRNNYSTWPNVNPYTGSIGSRYYPSYSGYDDGYSPTFRFRGGYDW